MSDVIILYLNLAFLILFLFQMMRFNYHFLKIFKVMHKKHIKKFTFFEMLRVPPLDMQHFRETFHDVPAYFTIFVKLCVNYTFMLHLYIFLYRFLCLCCIKVSRKRQCIMKASTGPHARAHTFYYIFTYPRLKEGRPPE